ncbi:hypothetical protein QW131_28325 [Roseibium salinum]|nr:hypothetical protein [Roseibium salinum]
MLSLSRYQDEINNTTREWYMRNRDFGSAYSRAFTSYWETIKAQVDADRAAAERKAQLVMLALSLAGGQRPSVAFSEMPPRNRLPQNWPRTPLST